MGDLSTHEKEYSELVDIFERDYQHIKPDPNNDLRSLRYTEDMKTGNWTGGYIIITLRDQRAVDGIYRGIAYLRCINQGVPEKKLPRIFLKT